MNSDNGKRHKENKPREGIGRGGVKLVRVDGRSDKLTFEKKLGQKGASCAGGGSVSGLGSENCQGR